MTIAASHNSNKVLSLGNDPSGQPNPTIGTGSSRDSVGLPVNAVFSRPYTYSDANGDGIITPNEVTIDPNYQYMGYSAPRDIFSVTNGFDLFNRKLRITVLTDYKGGNILNNSSYQLLFPGRDVVREQRADDAAVGSGALGGVFERQEPELRLGIPGERAVLEAA